MNFQNIELALFQVPVGCNRITFVRAGGGRWKTEKLETPAKPKRDLLGDYLRERCEIRGPSTSASVPPYECKAEVLREDLDGWLKAQGASEKISANAVGRRLTKLGIETRKSMGLSVYVGIRLAPKPGLITRA